MIELAPSHKYGLTLANPVMNAGGTLGFAGEFRGLIPLAGLGAFVTNPLTYSTRTVARPPNAVALPDGMLIHTGLPNPGLRAALRKHDRDWARLGAPVIVHLAATTPEDVTRALELLERARGVSGLELGLRDDVTRGELGRLVRAALGGPPLLVRLPAGRAAELAQAAARAGADALVASGAARGQVETAGQVAQGRLYGPTQFAAALQDVKSVAGQALGLPIVGAGGIYSVEDARQMLDAGALAVQVDAALWRQPRLAALMLEALSDPA